MRKILSTRLTLEYCTVLYVHLLVVLFLTGLVQ